MRKVTTSVIDVQVDLINRFFIEINYIRKTKLSITFHTCDLVDLRSVVQRV